ncbi:MAG: hypothetical protein EBS23_01775, partial [Betaproteobacteria bacterium]|nr:hypothetical protein [Betaproteobacteria bacterium]
MSRKRYSLGFVIAAFLVTASPVIVSAAADKSFAPAGNWVVNRIASGNGGSAYCTLARRFDGNMIVTLARNTNGESTVAIDFQQPLFQASRTYRVALQAGYGIKREFLTRPATANAMVLRTGQDPEFFGAIADKSDLSVIFDNGRYAFSIPDFEAGEEKLSGCIGASPAQMPRTPAAEPENAALSELRREIDALQQENASLAASLREDGAAASQARSDLSGSAENDALLRKLSALEAEKNALVDKLQSERTRQQREVQDVEALRQALSDQKELRQMLEAERQQRAELESALSDKTAEAEKRGELRARIEQLEVSNLELKSLRETLEAERSRRLMAEKLLQEQQQKSVATLEAQELLRTRVSELETQNATLQQTASDYQTTRVKLQTTESLVSEEQARRMAAERALQEVQMTAAEKEARIAKLMEQMDAERQNLERAEAQKQAALMQTHRDELGRLRAELEALRAVEVQKVQLSQSLSEEQARRAAAEQTLRQVQMSAAEKEGRIAELQQQMDAERQNLERAEAQKQAALMKTHQEELARLAREMEKLRAVEVQKEQLSRTLSAEQARREAVEKQLQQVQMTAAEKESRITDLQQKMDAERQNLERAEAQKQAALMKTHQEELARLSREMEKL